MKYKCKCCGKEYSLTEMRYYPHTNDRVCDKCFPEFRNKQFETLVEDDRKLMETITYDD